MPQDIEEYLFPEPRSGLKKRLQNIEVTSINPSVEVIYLQPEKEEGIDCIDFIEFAGHLKKYSDPLTTRFRDSLLKWRSPAGSEEHGD